MRPQMSTNIKKQLDPVNDAYPGASEIRVCKKVQIIGENLGQFSRLLSKAYLFKSDLGTARVFPEALTTN